VAAAQRHIQRGVIYVADRGIFSFAWLEDMLQAGADFVLRIKTSQKTRTLRDLPLSDADRAAGVLSDRIVVLEGCPGHPAPQSELREVRIADPNNPGHVVRLLTNLMDVEGWVLGEVYRHRWQIELFFRWLKVHAHFRHLISQNRNGILLSFYVAVIGVLLMYLHSGRKPSLYAYNLLCLVGQGYATLADIIPILANREREKELARKRLLKKKLEKQGR
jgi:IS4 transposase